MSLKQIVNNKVYIFDPVILHVWRIFLFVHQDNLAGWTALHIAGRRGDVRLVQYLRERCAGVAPRARDFANRTPRRLANKTAAARAFANVADDSESDSDSDDDVSDPTYILC